MGALGPSEASAQMATSPRKKKGRKKERRALDLKPAKINEFPAHIMEHFYAKFGYPSSIGFCE